MAKLHTLSPSPGSTHARKRKGRGPGSGLGKTSGRGHKGHKARSGGATSPHFEGGQMPLHRRIPKRGFSPPARVEYQVVNVRDLDAVEAQEITLELLKEHGFIGSLRQPVKILGDGTVKKALVVRAHAFSASARQSSVGSKTLCSRIERIPSKTCVGGRASATHSPA